MGKKIDLGILIFEITDACNQNCRFCYNYWKGGNEPEMRGVPSFKQAERVLYNVFKQANVGSISFSGGEPMMMSRIFDLILTARRHKTQVSVLTNGTLLTDSDVTLFKQLDVSRVQIPLLSADPAVHDALTQKPGSWEKAVAAFRKVSLGKGPRASAVLILTAENIQGLEETLNFYKRLGVQSVLLNRFNLGGNGLRYKESLALSHSQLKNAFSLVNAFASNTGMHFSSGVCTPVCVLSPKDYPNIAFSFCNTDVTSRPITINYKGEVRFCNHSPRVMGNLLEKGLQEILTDPENTAYYAALPPSCGKCVHLALCKGGCRAASEQVYHDYTRVDPLVGK